MTPPKVSLVFDPWVPSGDSPYRVQGPDELASEAMNAFLDAQALRGLSVRSLRSYGYSLVNAWRWLIAERKGLRDLCEVDLYDYVRFQKRSSAETAATTINHRLIVLRALYRYHHDRELPGGTSRERAIRRNPYLAKRRGRGAFHVKVPRRVVVPLGTKELRTFLHSLRTWRDLALASLMFLCGLRSCEVLELRLEDLSLSRAQALVRGKGGKERVLPLPSEVLSLVSKYLELERPEASADRVFVSLKGPRRGQPMTPAGLRTIFRHHRGRTQVLRANAHRFRHTFGTEAVRAGMSLPVLMKLMGHSQIDTTLRYVAVSDRDVWAEFQRVTPLIKKNRAESEGDGTL